jgi:hypothetical protein
MSGLFSNEELRRSAESVAAQAAEDRRLRAEAMQRHYQLTLVAASPPTPPPPPPQALPATAVPPAPFKYVMRTPEQWEKRMRQRWQNNRSFHPKWPKPAPKPRKKRVTVNQDASPAVGLTCGMSENVLAGSPIKPPRTRKKKTALVTGAPDLLPPAVEVNP